MFKGRSINCPILSDQEIAGDATYFPLRIDTLLYKRVAIKNEKTLELKVYEEFILFKRLGYRVMTSLARFMRLTFSNDSLSDELCI